MDQIAMENKIFRYGNLKPCKTAFIDAHTPGSDQKEIFTILAENADNLNENKIFMRTLPSIIDENPQIFKPFINNSIEIFNSSKSFIKNIFSHVSYIFKRLLYFSPHSCRA